MLSFLPGSQWFAIAGAVAAAGPVVIHLLNRRRFRVVHWAAMDFLREAVRRSRRILELRDLVLLAVRTLAVWLFGLALARPLVPAGATVSWRIMLPLLLGTLVTALAAVALWSRPGARKLLLGAAVALAALSIFVGGRSYLDRMRGSEAAITTDPSQPLHAVLIIDNSLSMGYKEERTLLDEAKARAERLIERLPEGSRIAVIPLCGSAAGFSLDPYPDKQDARTALERIELVDRRGSAATAIELAREACAKAPELPAPAKRVVFFSDQQRINWPADSLAPRLAELPELQVVDVSPGRTRNTWIASLTLQDGVADLQTPATIVVRVRHEAPEPRSNVQVILSVDEVDVAAKTIERLEPGPGGEAEIVFTHQFRPAIEPGQVRLVPVAVSLPSDQLRTDDRRHLAVPVVAAAPVVFVDQYGHESEDPKKGRLGETRELREMLAPALLGDDRPRELIAVRHRSIAQLDRKLLADARMVVIAGVADPGPAVSLLRQYVEQGGRLMIAAGGEFDVAAWNRSAWLDGEGILPVPLSGVVGRSADERAGTLESFFIAYDGGG
ncbi:MAG: BatA domain-containing protein, partial [Pirellulales bacterium]